MNTTLVPEPVCNAVSNWVISNAPTPVELATARAWLPTVLCDVEVRKAYFAWLATLAKHINPAPLFWVLHCGVDFMSLVHQGTKSLSDNAVVAILLDPLALEEGAQLIAEDIPDCWLDDLTTAGYTMRQRHNLQP